MSEPQEVNQDSSLFSNSNFLIVVWVFSFILFLCTPICMNRRRRLLWWRRFKYRRWHVYVEPERDPEWYRLALERYEAYRARATELETQAGTNELSKEEEDQIRQLFLLERMSGYTIEIKAGDIVSKTFNGEDNSEEVNDVENQQPDSPQANERTAQEGGEKENDSVMKAPDIGSEGPEMVEPLDNITESAEKDIETGNASNSNAGALCRRDSSDELDQLEETQMYETHAIVKLPLPGVALDANNEYYEPRELPNGCAICLGEFEVGDRVTWAANQDCPHAFHEDCLLRWMMSVGHKTSRRRYRNNEDPNRDPVEAATDFPMLCPCCRQQFILPKKDRENNADGDEDTPTESSSSSSSSSSRLTNVPTSSTLSEGNASDVGVNNTLPSAEPATTSAQ